MKIFRQTVLLVLVAALVGCASPRTFHDIARPSDTVAVPSGWKHTFTKDNITVTITPFTGPVITYDSLNNPEKIRAVTNLYVDPVSSLVVSRQVGVDLTTGAQSYSDAIHAGFTGPDKDWWQTIVVLDLPDTLAEGQARIDITTPEGESTTARLDIVSGTGDPNGLAALGSGPMTPDQLASLGRVAYNTVEFTGTQVPYAIQVELSHNLDAAHAGTGYAYVVNPIGYIKNVAWNPNDSGTGMRVIITPTRDGEIESMEDFTFYVAGGVNNLSVSSIQAFDIDGVDRTALYGVSAAVY